MQIDYVGRGLQLTDEIRSYVAQKLERAERFLEEPIEVRVILEEEGHRQIAEVYVHHRFGTLQADEESNDLKQSIHDVVDKIEKQARRSRKKFIHKRRRGDRRKVSEWPVEVVERESLGDGPGHRIIKTSALSIEWMSLDDAAVELESNSNDFVVFRDSEHGQINVLYKRRDGDYGLITPGA